MQFRRSVTHVAGQFCSYVPDYSPSSLPNRRMQASTWSAIAAGFSALSSILIALIHRTNMLEAARPELVLTGFRRERTPNGVDTIHVESLRNVGKGTALNVVANCVSPDTIPRASMGTFRAEVVAPGESMKVPDGIDLWWDPAAIAANLHLYLPVRIEIFCWDARGRRHITDYRLFAVPLDERSIIAGAVADGVGVAVRSTSSRAVWLIRFLSRPRWLIRLLARPKQNNARSGSA